MFLFSKTAHVGFRPRGLVLDPPGEIRDDTFRQPLPRRHFDFRVAFLPQRPHEQALLGFPWNEGRASLPTPQKGLTRIHAESATSLVTAMTWETGARQHGTDSQLEKIILV
jgi:hypothetical protein